MIDRLMGFYFNFPSGDGFNEPKLCPTVSYNRHNRLTIDELQEFTVPTGVSEENDDSCEVVDGGATPPLRIKKKPVEGKTKISFDMIKEDEGEMKNLVDEYLRRFLNAQLQSLVEVSLALDPKP